MRVDRLPSICLSQRAVLALPPAVPALAEIPTLAYVLGPEVDADPADEGDGEDDNEEVAGTARSGRRAAP